MNQVSKSTGFPNEPMVSLANSHVNRAAGSPWSPPAAPAARWETLVGNTKADQTDTGRVQESSSSNRKVQEEPHSTRCGDKSQPTPYKEPYELHIFGHNVMKH